MIRTIKQRRALSRNHRANGESFLSSDQKGNIETPYLFLKNANKKIGPRKVLKENLMEQLVITENVRSCAYVVYAVMLATTLVVYLSEWIFKKEMTNFKLRLKSFWLIVILFTVAFSFNKMFAFFSLR